MVAAANASVGVDGVEFETERTEDAVLVERAARYGGACDALGEEKAREGSSCIR